MYNAVIVDSSNAQIEAVELSTTFAESINIFEVESINKIRELLS